MPSKSYRTERAWPSRQLCRPLSTRRPGANTELPTAREKQQSKSNPSFPRETTLRVDQKLRRASSNDACAGLSLGGNTAAHHHSEELTADEKRHLTKEMMIKVTHKGRKGDPYDAELDDYHLCCLKEKLKCFVEDETKLDGDHILDYLDQEGLLVYIEKHDMFDWSFQYLTVAALDDYQRLVPQNCWMEDYIHIGWPTLKWRRICSRGESQAIKIATGFSNITFHNCTEGITEEVTEEKAQDLIADAITKLRTRPKFYADYIRKKIEIARAIGIVSPVSP
ncbi:hypothetical protein C2845_PM06G06070 [Panicum miliaceum]|uniref:Uncharacterized protein n=1 Tax=Panicum miliaceum TaxID=4540 RepID=A0A3L6R7F4_PANMI|nr:hypothetical protein C2845_PM06G06070 [Panicum miliaceum]